MTWCSVCGGTEFLFKPVLWPELIADMGLTSEEAATLDAQQGRQCTGCGANLRIVALGCAMRNALRIDATLKAFTRSAAAQNKRILDVNGVGALSDSLRRLPGYVRVDYPVVKLEALPFPAGDFDLVLHSDTLEHVKDPLQCVAECRRVLATDGFLCCTVPILQNRLTRSRAGLKASYHGSRGTTDPGMLVHWEFGADIWTLLFKAGFTAVNIVEADYPAGLALSAMRTHTVSDTTAAGDGTNAPSVSCVRNIGTRKHRVLFDAGKHILHAAGHAYAAISPTRQVPVIFGGRAAAGAYDQDGLRSIHNHDFMLDPEFTRAYRRGAAAAGTEYNWHWRVHVALWAAFMATKLEGDFVECGVNRGFMSSAIMDYLNWNRLSRTFFLLDTFQGIDARYVSASERAGGLLDRNAKALASGFYATDIEPTARNFAQWRNVKLICGSIPDTLPTVDATQIAFLHLDLNCSIPEVAAAEALWSRLSPGAPVLLDDYAYYGYESQKQAMDTFAAARGLSILSLPTGQGLLIKPPDFVAQD